MTIDSLAAVIDGVESAAQTVSILNYEGPPEVKDRIASYFEPQSVAVRDEGRTEGLPKNFALLHEGEEFLAASGTDELYEYVNGDAMLDADRFESVRPPAVLEHVDNRTFAGYDRRRMTLASREIEHRARREEGGELHAGFQRLSLLRAQRSVYERLRDVGVDVHVYGEPDAEIPSGLTEHAHADEEIAQSWFVVYEAEETPTDGRTRSGDGSDAHSCAMVATEREDGTFAGCWTYDRGIVDSVLTYLRGTYPPTESDGDGGGRT